MSYFTAFKYAKNQINKNPPIKVLIITFIPKYESKIVKQNMAKKTKKAVNFLFIYKTQRIKAIITNINKNLSVIVCSGSKKYILSPFRILFTRFYRNFINKMFIMQRQKNARS